MRDRVKRRKQQQEKQGQDQPAPLQPRFPDPMPDDIGNRQEISDYEASAPAEEHDPAPEDAQPPAAPGGGEQPPQGFRRDRNRRRGRRGRGGRSQQVAQSAQPTQAPSLPRKEPPRDSLSLFKRHNILPLSSDMVRILLFDDVTEQRYQDLVFSTLRSMLRARLLSKRPWNYLDATNLSPHERRSWIKLAHDFGYEAHAVFFDVPPEVCIERNRRRERNVPEDVMLRMANKLRPPKFEEGFAKITVVRLKKKDSEAGTGEEPRTDLPMSPDDGERPEPIDSEY